MRRQAGDGTPVESAKPVVERWVAGAPAADSSDAPSLWALTLAELSFGEKPYRCGHLPWVAAVFEDVAPPAALLQAMEDDLDVPAAKASSKALAARAHAFGPVLRRLAAKDAGVRAALDRYGGVREFVATAWSHAARCRRALANAAR